MAQDDPKKPTGATGKERTARRQADQAIIKEMDRRDRLLLNQIREVREATMRLAEASSFQFSLESSLMEISNHLKPIKDLAPQPAELDEEQAYALDKIRFELARLDEPKLYVIEGAGRPAGEQAAS